MRLRVMPVLLLATLLLPLVLVRGAAGARASCAEAAIDRYERCRAASRGWIEQAICDAEFVDAYNRCLHDAA